MNVFFDSVFAAVENEEFLNCVCMGECVRARSSACEGVTECSGVCVHLYSRWMCVKLFLVLMYVFTVLLLCFSDCHESTCAF